MFNNELILLNILERTELENMMTTLTSKQKDGWWHGEDEVLTQ